MKKNFFCVLLVLVLISCGLPASCLVDEVMDIETSHYKKDYSTSGTETYKVNTTEAQKKSREAARNAYSSAVAEKSVNMIPLFDDWTTREAQAKVNNIGTKIVLANELDDFVRFAVSRKEVVNATASYKGEVKVYKGLLQYVETEDELAYVLGHELGHIYKKDSRTRMIRYAAELGTITTGVVLAAAGDGATRKTGIGLITAGGVGTLAEPKLTRLQEARADISGIDFMVKAGYNPLAAISMMNKILDRTWDIVSDHPSGDKRMLAAYEHIEKNYPLYLEGGYDTIAYERALKYINYRRSKKTVKQNKKQSKAVNKNVNNKKAEEDI